MRNPSARESVIDPVPHTLPQDPAHSTGPGQNPMVDQPPQPMSPHSERSGQGSVRKPTPHPRARYTSGPPIRSLHPMLQDGSINLNLSKAKLKPKLNGPGGKVIPDYDLDVFATTPAVKRLEIKFKGYSNLPRLWVVPTIMRKYVTVHDVLGAIHGLIQEPRLPAVRKSETDTEGYMKTIDLLFENDVMFGGLVVDESEPSAVILHLKDDSRNRYRR